MAADTLYLETGSTDPAYNLAFEEVVLQNRREGNTLLLWQNDHAVVIGQNHNAEEEINHAYVEAHGIRVVRRMTGGGAVYHDLGNLNYSWMTDVENAGAITYQQFTRPVVEALRGLGMAAEASGRNDILVEGRKVSGTAQRLLGKRILHHGTLLFDSDPEMIAGALRVDASKFQSKSTKSVRSRVGNIREFLRTDMTLPDFWEYLKGSLGGEALQSGSLTEAEHQQVLRLKAEKYDAWEWTFGRTPRFSFANRHRWDGGLLEVRVQAENGRITAARFYGDFLSLCPPAPLEAALRGCLFQRADVAQALRGLPLQNYLGGIREQEVLDTMFPVSGPKSEAPSF